MKPEETLAILRKETNNVYAEPVPDSGTERHGGSRGTRGNVRTGVRGNVPPDQDRGIFVVRQRCQPNVGAGGVGQDPQ